MGEVDEAPTYLADSTDQQRVMDLVSAMQHMVGSHFDDPRDAMAFGMAAGMILAGTQYGMAVAIGLESGQRPRIRQILKTMERNFKAGVDISLRQVSRIAHEQGSRQ